MILHRITPIPPVVVRRAHARLARGSTPLKVQSTGEQNAKHIAQGGLCPVVVIEFTRRVRRNRQAHGVALIESAAYPQRTPRFRTQRHSPLWQSQTDLTNPPSYPTQAKAAHIRGRDQRLTMPLAHPVMYVLLLQGIVVLQLPKATHSQGGLLAPFIRQVSTSPLSSLHLSPLALPHARRLTRTSNCGCRRVSGAQSALHNSERCRRF
jgi:hypothetical protein